VHATQYAYVGYFFPTKGALRTKPNWLNVRSGDLATDMAFKRPLSIIRHNEEDVLLV